MNSIRKSAELGKMRIHKLKLTGKKLYCYIRYDLTEIAFPSSLPDPPDPPGFKERRKLTWNERFLLLKKASRIYCASWVRDIGPDLRPNDYKKDEGAKEEKASKGDDSSTWEDLAVAARGGMETFRPALHRVYMTKASTYKDALRSFIQGYQEGIKQVMEKEEESKTKPEDHTVKK